MSNVFPIRAEVPSAEPLVRAAFLAEHLSVTERTIRRWQAAGMPSVKRRNGARLFRVSEVEAWLAAQE